MSLILRIKNKAIAKLITKIPALSAKFTDSYKPVESDYIPWTPFNKQLSECKIALVTTSGVHHKNQTPFDMNDKNGDPSFRIIDSDKPVHDLMITHDYYDHSDADKDINIVFPIERLREFKAEGIIKEISQFNYSFMGHIDSHHIQTLISETGPEVAIKLKKQNVDIVLLTPGWGICNQSVGLIQREIESRNIPTIGVSIVRNYSEKVKPPRTIFLKWPFGHPLGEPFNIAQHRTIIRHAFKALSDVKTPGEIVDLPYRWRREIY